MSTELQTAAEAPAQTARRVRGATLPRRLLGGALIALPLLPLYRLLDTPRTGLAGQATTQVSATYAEFAWSGILLVLAFALVGGIVQRDLAAVVRTCLAPLTRLSTSLHALLLAVAAGALTLGFSLYVLDGKPNHIDSIAQVLHARYWAEGRLAGDMGAHGAFFGMQNALLTERGWVSQYPPGHVALLAAGLLLGVPALVGAVLVAITVFFATLIADRLFQHDRLLARVAPTLLLASPFFICLGGSYMNHATVGAAVAVGTYALIRAMEGQTSWALLVGVAFAWAFATRPLSSMALAAAIGASATFLPPRVAPLPRLGRMLGLACLGALPVLAAFFAHNALLFGAPLRTGYALALGPNMRLGFHQDPWGNQYGHLEALGYTAADLLALSVSLFEGPLPAVAVIGAFVLLARRLERGTGVLLAWALAPVAAGVLYWHHGLFMGPRMLHEAASAWVLLFAVACFGIVHAVPAATRVAGRLHVRNMLVVGFCAAAGIGMLFAPYRAAAHGGEWLGITRLAVPAPAGPAVVFVHDAWAGRIAMTLAAGGYRLDQVETLLRQNATCAVHQLAGAVAAGNAPRARALLAALDTIPRADRLPPSVELASGNRIRMWPGEQLGGDCLRQARSDRYGILDVAPLLWQGDLPDVTGRGVLFARDLGPERNATLLARFPDRTPWLYTMVPGEAEPKLLPYAAGMNVLWGEAP